MGGLADAKVIRSTPVSAKILARTELHSGRACPTHFSLIPQTEFYSGRGLVNRLTFYSVLVCFSAVFVRSLSLSWVFCVKTKGRKFSFFAAAAASMCTSLDVNPKRKESTFER